jgi:glutaredoxin
VRPPPLSAKPDAGADPGAAGAGAGRGAARVVTVYGAPDCHLCADALAHLRALRAELAFELRERDITRDDALHRAYLERIPVVTLDGEELFDYVVDEQILRERLESRA